ncbi:MAG: baseplate assembly protein [Deferribacterales bacterium]
MNSSKDIKTLLKKVIEILMPNLDHYRRPLRKGKVVATYPSDGSYVCDVEVLLNNEQPDETEPLIKDVEIPVIWAGKNRGIICPPAVGTLCDVEYYHGDPNYPRISNFRWQGSGAPNAEVDELIIQQKNGVYIRITAAGDIEAKTPKTIKAEAGGTSTLKSDVKVIIDAPETVVTEKLTAKGLFTYEAGLEGSGESVINGALKASTVESETISLDNHVHGGVASGSQTSGTPE